MKQLTSSHGGSVFFEVTRNSDLLANDSGDFAQIVVKYQIEYKGPKGQGDLS